MNPEQRVRQHFENSAETALKTLAAIGLQVADAARRIATVYDNGGKLYSAVTAAQQVTRCTFQRNYCAVMKRNANHWQRSPYQLIQLHSPLRATTTILVRFLPAKLSAWGNQATS